MYELEGFRELVPDEILQNLVDSEPVPEGTMLELPERYTVLARRGPTVHAFKNMQPEVAGQVQGGMAMDFVSDDDAVRIRTVLNFEEERLHFDPVRGVGFVANRHDSQQVQHEIRVLELQRCILGNGHLEIWEPESDKILGRSETCIPVNCFVNHDFYRDELAKLSEILEQLNEQPDNADEVE